MRRFAADYLAHTRRGLWDDREALAPLRLADRRRILDVGCGTGSLTRVLREESKTPVVGLDADAELLRRVDPPIVRGDASRLPFGDGTFDLVVCQALLINLTDPATAVEEFVRVSADLVAAIEPDNEEVRVRSTVDAEGRLARRGRDAYAAGVPTDVSLGSRVADLFDAAGLHDVRTIRHHHRQTIEPPYADTAVEGAAVKASGARLAEQRETLLSGGMDEEAFDSFREEWRAMGREVVEQMESGEYERVERVPFYVTVGRV